MKKNLFFFKKKTIQKHWTHNKKTYEKISRRKLDTHYTHIWKMLVTYQKNIEHTLETHYKPHQKHTKKNTKKNTLEKQERNTLIKQ